jgi:hypothetical protein
MWSFIFFITTPLNPICVPYLVYTSSYIVSLVIIYLVGLSPSIGKPDTRLIVLVLT